MNAINTKSNQLSESGAATQAVDVVIMDESQEAEQYGKTYKLEITVWFGSLLTKVLAQVVGYLAAGLTREGIAKLSSRQRISVDKAAGRAYEALEAENVANMVAIAAAKNILSFAYNEEGEGTKIILRRWAKAMCLVLGVGSMAPSYFQRNSQKIETIRVSQLPANESNQGPNKGEDRFNRLRMPRTRRREDFIVIDNLGGASGAA